MLCHFPDPTCCAISLVLPVVTFTWSCVLWHLRSPACCDIHLVLRVVSLAWSWVLWYFRGSASCEELVLVYRELDPRRIVVRGIQHTRSIFWALAFFITILYVFEQTYSALVAREWLWLCDIASATRNCCNLGSRSVHTIQSYTSLQCYSKPHAFIITFEHNTQSALYSTFFGDGLLITTVVYWSESSKKKTN